MKKRTATKKPPAKAASRGGSHLRGKARAGAKPSGPPLVAVAREAMRTRFEIVIADLSGPPNYWDEATIRHNVLEKYSLDQIVPPPNWVERYRDGYTVDNPPPNPARTPAAPVRFRCSAAV